MFGGAILVRYQTIELTVDFFKKETDGHMKHLIDVNNMVCGIGGVDIRASQRGFLLG